MTEEKKMYQREAVRICEGRGWDAEQIRQFLNVHGNMTYGYTLDMIDSFEYSVNGPVIEDLHPSMMRNL